MVSRRIISFISRAKHDHVRLMVVLPFRLLVVGIVVPRAGLEPARPFGPEDFKSGSLTASEICISYLLIASINICYELQPVSRNEHLHLLASNAIY